MDNHFYQSPFSWRYGSDRMREIWSVKHTRMIWREIWAALAEVESEFGLVDSAQAAALRDQVKEVDLERSFEIEARVNHDLVAELEVYGEQCPEAKGILHLGATSMDIKDNALVLQSIQALGLILDQSRDLLLQTAELIKDHARTPVLGYTHLQPAEPTTLGYRLAQPAQDIYNIHGELQRFLREIQEL